MYSAQFRHLRPGLGRWLRRDPISIGGGDANLYRYVGNRPTIATDPSGLVLVIANAGEADAFAAALTDIVNRGESGIALRRDRIRAEVVESNKVLIVTCPGDERSDPITDQSPLLGARLVRSLINDSYTYTLSLAGNLGGAGQVLERQGKFNFDLAEPDRLKMVPTSPEVLVKGNTGTDPATLGRRLAHELGHAVFNRGIDAGRVRVGSQILDAERLATTRSDRFASFLEFERYFRLDEDFAEDIEQSLYVPFFRRR